MLEGARMTLGNRYTNTIFIDSAHIYREWRARIFFCFHRGALQKIIGKHWPICYLLMVQMQTTGRFLKDIQFFVD